MANQINIGTEGAPMYVPEGSAAYQNWLQTQGKTTPTKTTEAQERYNQLVGAGASSDVALNAVRQIPGMGTVEINTNGAPPIDTGAGDLTATGQGLINSINAYQDKLQKDFKDRLATSQQQQQTQSQQKTQGILDTLTGYITKRKDTKAQQKSTQEIYEETLAEYGLTQESVQRVKTLMGQLEAYQIEQVNLEAQKQAKLDKAEQLGMPMDYIKGSQALIERQYNSKISAAAAKAGVVSTQIQLEQGLWDDARTTANQIVNAATYDQQQAVADIEWAMETYQDLYAIMRDEEQNSWNRAYQLAKDELDMKTDEMNNIMNLMLQYPKAGINIDDTVAEATQKAQAWSAAQAGGTTRITPGGAETGKEAAGTDEAAVIDLINFGITDPTTLLNLVNYDEAGNRIRNISLNEVNSILGLMLGTKNDFTDQEKRKLEQAGLLDASRKEQLDYLYKKDEEDPETLLFGEEED